MIDQWGGLIGALGLEQLAQPRILPLSSTAPGYADAVLRVAIIGHPRNVGRALVNGLRNQLRRSTITGVTVDLGYFLSLVAAQGPIDGGPDTVDGWSVVWEPEHVNELRRPLAVAVPSSALGAAFVSGWPKTRKVVLVDTGDEGAACQIGFDLSDSDEEVPCDNDGHGTSVGSLIRMVAPDATVDCFRVLPHGDRVVHAGALLNALTEALHPAIGYHLVSVPLRADIGVEERGKRLSLQRILNQHANTTLPTPVVVCAAGNDGPNAAMDYPATAPGVMVAVGFDWSGVPAGYNCRRPRGAAVHTVGAFGGIEADPLGTLRRPGQESKVLYGSSYATALITGAIASA